MFTGIIEKLGKVIRIDQRLIEISADFQNLELGESISVNGICLTVKNITKKNNVYNLSFDISPETYSRTNLKFIKRHELVNLERSLKLSSRIGGHLVAGHVDEVIKILRMTKYSDSYEFVFSVSNNSSRYIAEKGSVAIDGISLTVASKFNDSFSVFIVPYTYDNTNLKFRKIGDFVNLEVDILARYVDSVLSSRENRNKFFKTLFENN